MSKLVRFLVWTGVILAIVVAALRFLLFESWTIPENDAWLGALIAPTLRGGDTVLVLTRGKPTFGDLTRCKDPEDPNTWVVGRIVGQAGDVVEVAGATLVVNGKRYESNEACEEAHFKIQHPDTGSEVELNCSRVELAGSWHFQGQGGSVHVSGDDKKHTVGDGRVFLLSDDRDVHDDSRDFGAIPAESCHGKIVFRLWGKQGWGDSKSRLMVIR
jgi:signal peptidase I